MSLVVGDFGYPFTNTIGQNTPENFRTALEQTKQRLFGQPVGPRILNINCWNEWTEGSYLEPDTPDRGRAIPDGKVRNQTSH